VQNIQIPDDQYAKLTETAIAASYQNVEAMIQGNTEKIPPLGTPVRLVLKPKKGQ